MLGAQNVSPFDEGAYTGEVNAKQIKDFVQYVLIGHSERRQNFNETEDMLIKKVDMTLKYGLNPIFLVQNQEDVIPQGVQIVAYDRQRYSGHARECGCDCRSDKVKK
jgi:triosephosphate isomerase